MTLAIQFPMLSLACRDVGVDCDYAAKGETEEELWVDGTGHVIRDHGFKREDVNEKFKAEHKLFIKRS
jgi:predicted small metal-binding protein